jgi:hypothetical protein
MTSEEFEGFTSEMRESPWLASEDIMGHGELPVTIESVHRHKDVAFDQGRKKDVVYAIKFAGTKKQLVLNATNRKTLVRLFGSNVKRWKEQRVCLFVDDKVKLAGKFVNGIRIKEARDNG